MLASTNPATNGKAGVSATASLSSNAPIPSGRAGDQDGVAPRVAVQLEVEQDGLEEDGAEPRDAAQPDLERRAPVPEDEHEERSKAPEARDADVAPVEGRGIVGSDPLGELEDSERSCIQRGQGRRPARERSPEGLRAAEGHEQRRNQRENAAESLVRVPRLGVEREDRRPESQGDDGHDAVRRAVRDRVELVERRLPEDRVHEGTGQVGERDHLVLELVGPPRQPGEDGCLRGPGEGQRGAGQDDRDCDPSEPEGDDAEERAEIALARTREQSGGGQALDDRGAEQDPPFVGAVEERDARDPGQQRAEQDERRGERRERSSLEANLKRDGGREVEEPEGCGDGNGAPRR